MEKTERLLSKFYCAFFLFLIWIPCLGIFLGIDGEIHWEKWWQNRNPLQGFTAKFSKYFNKSFGYVPVYANSLSPKQVKIAKSELATQQKRQIIHDAILGWTTRPSANSSINKQAIRSSQIFSQKPKKGKVRICALGDSFTQAWGVSNHNTWEEQMNFLSSKIEILNMGVGGYGIGQAYLRYLKEGTLFFPHIVFLGFMSENIKRSVNVYRPFYATFGKPYSKPRFLLKGDKLILQKNPLSALKDYELLFKQPRITLAKLGQNDYYFQSHYHQGKLDIIPMYKFSKILLKHFYYSFSYPPIVLDNIYNEKSEAFAVTKGVFDLFHQKVLHHNSLPIIVLFPHQEDLEFYRYSKKIVYQPLKIHFQKKKYLYIDLLDAFEKHKEFAAGKFFGSNAHYNILGNQIVARYIVRWLQQRNLLDIKEIQKKIKK